MTGHYLVCGMRPLKKAVKAAFCFSGIPAPAGYAALIRPTALRAWLILIVDLFKKLWFELENLIWQKTTTLT